MKSKKERNKRVMSKSEQARSDDYNRRLFTFSVEPDPADDGFAKIKTALKKMWKAAEESEGLKPKGGKK